MKLAIPVFTAVAVILVAGASDASAQAPNRAPAFANGPTNATLSGFIADKPVEEKEIMPFDSTFTGYVHDRVSVGSRAARQPSASKGRFVNRVRGSSATMKGHGAARNEGIHQKGSKKGAYGYAPAERSWLYDPWVSFEYMNVWIGERELPPLVTTSPPGSEGVLPGAKMLFGAGQGGDAQAAGRLTLGAWLAPNRRVGIVGRFFATDSETISFEANSDSDGQPLLARPFYETWDGAVSGIGPAAFQVSGVRDVNGLDFTLQGHIDAHSETEVLGADAYVRYMLHCRRGRRVDLIAGYQFSRVDDTLYINSVTDITPGVFGARVEVHDGFETTNKFHGGQIGLLGEMDSGAMTLSLLAKVGLGNMNEVVTISGRSQLTDIGGNQQTHNGGMLALPTNIGTYKKDRFAVLPELEAKATWRLTRNLDFSVGYTVMYWNNLAMVGDQIETINDVPAVNSSQWFGNPLTGPANPVLTEIVDGDLFLHALNVGLTFRL